MKPSKLTIREGNIQASLLKAGDFPWLHVERKSETQSTRGQGVRKEGSLQKLRARKDTGPQIYSHQNLDSADNPGELGERFPSQLPQASPAWRSPAGILVSVCETPVNAAQASDQRYCELINGSCFKPFR